MKTVLSWLMIFGGVAWALWTFGLFSSSTDRAKAYEAAPACPDGKPAPACRAKLTAVVADKQHVYKNRHHKYLVTLRASDGDVLDVNVGNEHYEAIAVKQTIEIERWNRQVTKIYRDGKALSVVQTPKARRSVLMAAFAIGLTVLGVAWVLVARRRNRKRSTAIA